MNTAIVPFTFEGFEIRTAGTIENPMFVVVDVCEVLGLVNPSETCSRIPEDWKGISSTDTPSGTQEVLFVSEPGLYELIFASRKPVAKRFRRWVFEEVLPAIRKTGKYNAKPEDQEKFEPFNLHLNLRAVQQNTIERLNYLLTNNGSHEELNALAVILGEARKGLEGAQVPRNAPVASNPEQVKAKVIELIKASHRGITVRNLMRSTSVLKNAKDAHALLRSLERDGIIRSMSVGKTIRYTIV